MGKFAPRLLKHFFYDSKLTGPFSSIMDGVVKDQFIRNWLNMLCFLLSGLPADGTSAAEVAFMFADWYRPGVKLDYPIGGAAALVDALVRGFQKYDGKLLLKSHVEEIIVENKRAVGVRLRNGEELRADVVISNASVWDTLKLIPSESVPQQFFEKRRETPE